MDFFLSDEYLVSLEPQDLIERSEEMDQSFLEEEQQYLTAIEKGHHYTRACLLFSYIWRPERFDQLREQAQILLAVPAKTNEHCIAYYALAGLEVAHKNVEKAIEWLQKGRETWPMDGFLCRALGSIFMHQKRYQDALDILVPQYEDYRKECFEENEPDEGFYCDRIGYCYAMNNDHNKAIEWFKRALNDPQYESEHAVCHYRVGLCWQSLEDEYRALAAYQRALELMPNFAAVYVNLGAIAYNFNANIKQAIELLRRALTHIDGYEPPAFEAWTSLARLYNKIADYDNAAECKMHMLRSIGFPATLEFEDDESEDDQGESVA